MLMTLSYSQAFQFRVPRRPIWTYQHLRRFRIGEDRFFLGVPTNTATEAQRDIRQMTDRGDPMATLQVGNRLLARLDAVEEITRMQLELGPAIAGGIRDRFRPVARRTRVGDRHGAADGMSTGKLRYGVCRDDLPIRRHGEATARDAQASLGTEELQTVAAGGSARGFAVRPDCRPARILDQGVLRVR